MSFPLSPEDGYSYTSPDDIKFTYNASKNAWDIEQVLASDDRLSSGVSEDAAKLLLEYDTNNIWKSGNQSSFNLDLSIPEFSKLKEERIIQLYTCKYSEYSENSRHHGFDLSLVLPEFLRNDYFLIYNLLDHNKQTEFNIGSGNFEITLSL